MNPAKVTAIFDEGLEYLTHARHVVNTLKTKTIYRIECKYNVGRYSSPDIRTIDLVAKVKAYNKQSVRLQVLASQSMECLRGDLSNMQKKLLYKKLDGEDGAKRYWELSQAERTELIKDIEIPNLETTLDYAAFNDWSVFEPNDVPFIVGYEYISPKFKKEFFHA